MGKRIQPPTPMSFGERLASLRKAADFAQMELAAELGVSQRMVAGELFGVGDKRRLVKQDGDSRLRRRLLAIEKLDMAEKRQVLQLLDAFIERGQLKRKVESRA